MPNKSAEQEQQRAEHRKRAIKLFRNNQVKCTAKAEKEYLLKLAKAADAQRLDDLAKNAEAKLLNDESADTAAVEKE